MPIVHHNQGFRIQTLNAYVRPDILQHRYFEILNPALHVQLLALCFHWELKLTFDFDVHPQSGSILIHPGQDH